jgi:2-polyprenyl-6-methoxyphenol hydroxylase-like FAD-dependent oxidoreductase
MNRKISLDVLIIGAGPTGLSLAIALRQCGVAVRIVDRALEPSAVSKALVLWSASLEALQGMGAPEGLLADGKHLKALEIGDGKRRLARLAVGAGIDSAFPFPLLLPQSHTERFLTARLAALGVTIERGIEFTGLAQDANSVTATLAHGDGHSETVRARYLVGCDGARSAVRHALGIDFEGKTEPQTFLLGDVRIDGGLDRDNIYLWWGRKGTVAFFPFGQDIWRVFALREDEAKGTAPPTLAELQAHADRHGPPGLTLRDPIWLSAFGINERVAAHYRRGRCFLAGDAAHIHSPAGGQGMNTGIQDAVNLGWKLGHVLKGCGDAGLLLDSYEAERRPVAQDVVAGAEQKLHLAFSSGAVTRMLKDVAVSILGNLPFVQRRLQIELSETEITYRHGPLVALGEPPRRPRRTDVGTRARDGSLSAGGEMRRLWPLLGHGRHVLLLFESPGQPIDLGAMLDDANERLVVLRISQQDAGAGLRARYHQVETGWVLIRPDQVVAARGGMSDLALLHHYFDRVIRANDASCESEAGAGIDLPIGVTAELTA